MTLTELAYELKKIFSFNYLTVDNRLGFSVIRLWLSEDWPFFYPEEWNCVCDDACVGGFDFNYLKEKLDLSEFTDKNGNIDYSKCIVEVK